MLLRYKTLLLTIVPMAIILVIISGLTVNNKINTERELLLGRLSSYRVLLESGDLAFETSANKAKLEQFFNEKVEFSEILGRNYRVIYSSENSAAPLITEEEKKEVDDAFQGIETTKNIGEREGKKTAFVIITPLIVNNKIVAVIHQGLSNEKSNGRVMEYAFFIVFLILCGIATCFIFVWFLMNKAMLTNIYKLKHATMEVQKGNLDTVTEARSKDELGNLSTAFNAMIQEIKGSRKKLEEYSRELEEKVGERTKELEESKSKLEDKITELEKFSKMSVGRELKMVELKKRISELEDKLKKNG